MILYIKAGKSLSIGWLAPQSAVFLRTGPATLNVLLPLQVVTISRSADGVNVSGSSDGVTLSGGVA